MSEQDELEEYRQQLASVEEGLSADPKDETLLSLRTELKELIGLLEVAVDQPLQLSEEVAGETKVHSNPSSLQAASTKSVSSDLGSDNEKKVVTEVLVPLPPLPPPSTSTHTPSPPSPHPGLSTKASKKFEVGDTVLARWLSGDKQFYQARVTLVAGSSANPRYTVKFAKHGTMDTVAADCVRPVASTHPQQQKIAPKHLRHIPSATISSSPVVTSPVSSTQPTQQNSNSIKPKQQPSTATLLDNSKNKWQDFAQKQSKKSGFKRQKVIGGSMFRSPDDAVGKVGVVGSGKGMTKDRPKGRHVFDEDSRIE